MSKFLALVLIACIPAVIVYSCKHEPVLPEHQVSFSTEVMPVIQMGCQHAGCHGDSLNEEFKLIDYQSVIDQGEVIPGDPNGSKLYQVITAPENSEDHMPRAPYASLSRTNVKLIYIWIAQGAPNN